MAGFLYSGSQNLIRSNIWSTQLKEILLAELFAMKYVNMLTDFSFADTINIPSIGQPEVLDYVEGQAIRYTAMDTGNFTFSITDYKASGTYITNRMKQDSYVADQLISSFVPKQERAIMTAIEQAILAIPNAGQTASNLNSINGTPHRFVATGTSQYIALQDFARALYSLKKSNVPQTNLVAIVDPSVEYTLNTLTNITNVLNNPMWEGIVSTGIASGMRFVKNIYGFDVYTSMYLPSGISETINSVSVTNGAASYFFSATPDVLPIVGSLRQPPKVDSEYNKDLQREEYVTTCRYGFGFYRPENMVTVLTNTSV